MYLSYVFQCLLLLGKRFPLNNLNSIEFQDLNFVYDDIISFRLTVYSEGIFTFNIRRVTFSFSLLEGITPKLAKTIKNTHGINQKMRAATTRVDLVLAILCWTQSTCLRQMSVVSFHHNQSNIKTNGLQEQTDISKTICFIFIFPINHPPKTKGARIVHQKNLSKWFQSPKPPHLDHKLQPWPFGKPSLMAVQQG